MDLHEAADRLRHSSAGGDCHIAEARPAENAHREWAAQLAAPVGGGQRPSTRRKPSVAIDLDHEEDACPLRVLAGEYLRGRYRRGEVSATTIRQARSTLGRLGEVHGRQSIDQFGPATIRAYQESIAHLRPSARASAWSCVTGFTRWLMAEGHVAVDPCLGGAGAAAAEGGAAGD